MPGGATTPTRRAAAALGCALLLLACCCHCHEEDGCAEPCHVVADYHPFPNCKATCDKDVCGRGARRRRRRRRRAPCILLAGTSVEVCPTLAAPHSPGHIPAGYNVYKSKEICCSPGVAFPDGCRERPKECWVVEDTNAHTCRRDDRKCLQGAGVVGRGGAARAGGRRGRPVSICCGGLSPALGGPPAAPDDR
jgi:hypothetical protein